MPFDTIFTVKKGDLGALGADDAIRFMAELLWSEARRIGVSVAAVNISSRINVPEFCAVIVSAVSFTSTS